MTEIKELLKQMMTAPGLSGYETPVRTLIEQAWQPLANEIHTSRLGSLHALRKGSLTEPRPSLLLAAHMDAIRLMVSGIVDGFLRLVSIGGLDPRVLPGQQVTVHGRTDLPGVIIQPPAHLLPADSQDKTVFLDYLFVDVGLLPSQVQRQVRLGDLVSFAQQPFEIGKDFLAGHSLDNRASVAAVTSCLEKLQDRQLSWDLWAAATVQEEETLGGVRPHSCLGGRACFMNGVMGVIGAEQLGNPAGLPAFEQLYMDTGVSKPQESKIGVGDVAVFDRSFLDLGQRWVSKAMDVALGKGPAIKVRDQRILADPRVVDWMVRTAKGAGLPYQLEILKLGSTDASAIQLTRAGVLAGCVSIPCRYIHTPSEMVDQRDVENAV